MKSFIIFAAIIAIAACLPAGDVQIVRQAADISPEGAFNFAYETSDGSLHQAAGDANSVKGNYKFISPEGENIEITYVADENGYQPSGASIPVPPPEPEYVARALAYIAAHPSKE